MRKTTKKNLKRNREWKPFEDNTVEVQATNKRKYVVFEDQPSPIREINSNENFKENQTKVVPKTNPFQSSSMEEEYILPKVRNCPK
jgi:hypothetical protein